MYLHFAIHDVIIIIIIIFLLVLFIIYLVFVLNLPFFLVNRLSRARLGWKKFTTQWFNS